MSVAIMGAVATVLLGLAVATAAAEGDAAVEFKASADRKAFHLQWTYPSGPPIAARLSWEMRDLDGPVLGSGEGKLELTPGVSGERVIERLTTEPVVEGTFKLSAEGWERTAVIASVAVDIPRRDDAVEPDSPWGVGLYHHMYSPEDYERALDTARDAGIKWVREAFHWDEVMPEPGRFTWEACDRVVELAEARGISLCVLLNGWPPKHEFTTEEGIKQYCEYVRAVVTRYRGRVKYWELWNEPNIQYFWVGTPEQYAAQLTAAYRACKEADPDCQVLGICTAGTDLKFIERVIKAAGPDVMDILVIHPYRYPRTPEETDLIAEIRRAAEVVRGLGPARRIWITELGWMNDPGPYGGTDVKQAQMIVRSYLESLASGEVDKIFWHIHRDSDYGFGIVHPDMTPKPAYVAIATASEQLHGLRLVRRIPAAGANRVYLFEGGGKSVLAAWNGLGAGSIVLRTAGEAVTITDMVGRRRSVAGGETAAAVALTGSPTYISAARMPSLGTPILEATGPAEASPGEDLPLTVVVRNIASTRSSGTVEVIPPATWKAAAVSAPVVLEPGASARLELAVRPGLDTPLAECAVQVKWTAGDVTWMDSAPVRLRPLVEDIPGACAPPGEAVITIRNTSGRRALAPAFITFRSDAGPVRRRATIPPLGEAQFAVPLLPAGETPFPYRKLPLTTRVRVGDSALERREEFHYGACGPAPRVTVDGRLEEWQALPCIVLDQLGDIVERRPGSWGGPQDFSARVWTAWDDRAFYVAAEVRDDLHYQKWMNIDLTGREFRRGDCLRFAVDPQPRQDSTVMRGYEYGLIAKGMSMAGMTASEFLGWKMSAPVIRGYEYGTALTYKGVETYRFYSPDGRQESAAPELEAVVTREGELTRYEIAAPWAALAPLRPEPGRWFGFAVLVNNEDGTNNGGIFATWGDGFGGQYRNPDARLYGRLMFRETWGP